MSLWVYRFAWISFEFVDFDTEYFQCYFELEFLISVSYGFELMFMLCRIEIVVSFFKNRFHLLR
jgi:hypothetical protein